jgi:hypothetical protein
MKFMVRLIAAPFIVCLASQANSAGWDSSCSGFSSGSAMPQGCMLPPTAGLGGVKTQAFSVDDIRGASYAKPVSTRFPKDKSLYEYDLKVDNICDSANSITTIATNWVGERPGNFSWYTEDKSVAMIAVVSFPDEKDVKQVKVPILAKANFGDPNVQNCDGVIIKRVKANTSMSLHFEYKSRSVGRFPDQSKFLGGVAKVAASAAAMAGTVGGAPFAAAVITPAVDFLEKSANPVKMLNEGANDILQSFADDRNPDPKSYPVDPNTRQLLYKNGKTSVFTVTKIDRPTGIALNPAAGWAPVFDDFSRVYGPLQEKFFNAQTAVDSPWNSNLAKFCEKLRLQVTNAAKGDRIAGALGLGSHAYLNNGEYPQGKTCLNSFEVATLSGLGYAPPFPGAWSTQVAESATVPPRQKDSRTVSQNRSAYARLNR